MNFAVFSMIEKEIIPYTEEMKKLSHYGIKSNNDMMGGFINVWKVYNERNVNYIKSNI